MFSSKIFFDKVRAAPFGGALTQVAVDRITLLIKAFVRHGDRDQRKLAYILGTAFHEGDRFKASEEYASGAAYEGRKDLGNTVKGDGVRYKGRGFAVMITGRRNYFDWSDRLGLDLIVNPDLAALPENAAYIGVVGMMKGTFTGKKLADYIDGDKCDFVGARRTVNGTDKASLIAGYASAFLAALDASDFDSTVVPIPTPAPDPEPVIVEPAPEPVDPSTVSSEEILAHLAELRSDVVAFSAANIAKIDRIIAALTE